MTVVEHAAEEIKRLQHCIGDLVGLVALPASWAGADPAHIARTLLDVLERKLALELVFIRLIHPSVGSPIAMARMAPGGHLPARADAIGAMLDVWLDRDPRQWPPLLRERFGSRELSVVPLPIGLQGDLGVLAAGSARADFPNQTERLLLTVAKNQLVIALQDARLLSEQRRLAETLDRRVARRTAELAAAVEELRRSESRKAAILDSALDCIVTIDHQGRITEFNPAAERTFGYRREEVLGALLGDLIVPPALRERHRQGLARYMTTGEGVMLGKRVELTGMRADGTEFPLEVAITRISGDGPPSFTGYLRDITSRKQAEEKLRRSEAFLAEAQRLSQTGSFSWRETLDEISWSDQVYRIFELERDIPLTLDRILSRVHPEDVAQLLELIRRAGSDGSDFEYEYRLLMPDHSVKHLHVVAHALRDQDGRLEYIGAVQDVTDRRLSEEALGKARSDLAHVSRVTSLGVLTASIAHEVNQPLAGIITNAGTCLRMLATDPPNVDGAKETARRTIRDGNRASDVIKRLRSLFDRRGITAEPMDLNEAAREVFALSLRELQSSRVLLRAELADELPPALGDRVQLQQVILNLLRNAVDAMSGVADRPRQLIVRTEEEDGDRVRLTVQDSGVGFGSESAGRLFEAFYTTKAGGMGIGLSVSRSIIENHNGRLWASPNDGPGATFAFSIPRAPAG